VKKVLKIAAIAVPCLLLVLGLILYFSLNSMVQTAVTAVAPKVTGTPVELRSVSLFPFSGKGTIEGFIIGNPEGFNTKQAFALGTVRVNVDVASLFSDKIVIEEIFIDAPQITYELGLGGSNIGKIKKNIDAFTASEEKKPAEEKGSAKTFQVNRFRMQNGRVTIATTVLKEAKASAALPAVEVKDIGTGPEGASLGQLAQLIYAPVDGAVAQAVKEAKGALGDGVGAVKKGAGDVLDAGKEGVKGAVDGIKKIFK
jgi:hypothetical protein